MSGRILPLLFVWTLTSAVFSQEASPRASRSFLPPELSSRRAADADTITTLLVSLVRDADGRLRTLDIARTRQGRPVRALVATLAPPDRAPDLPATLVVAGLRPQDESGVHVALELCARLAADSSLDELLERRVFYVVPLLNPDLYGSRLPYETSGRLNGGGDDDDRDRQVDEDGARDLDGDGHVTTMRIPDPTGDWVVAADPWNPDDRRLMRRVDRTRGELGEFRLEVEALDADGDGQRAEDGAGETDLFVHFPALWEPRHRSPGAGHCPLWEPEARGLVDALLVRRHIGTAYVLGGSGSQVLLPAWALPPEDLPEADLTLLRSAAEELREAAGLEQVRSAHDQERQHGTLLDWLYWEHGALALQVDPWGVPAEGRETVYAERSARWRDVRAEAVASARRADPTVDEDDVRARWEREHPERPTGADGEPVYDRNWLRWCSRFAPDGGYSDWTTFQHPQLGTIEIGGWLPVGRALPPDAYLEEMGTRVAGAILATCDRAPELRVTASAHRLDNRVDAVYEVTAHVANVGTLPTATRRAQSTRRAAEVTLELLGDGVVFLIGAPRQRAGHLFPGDGSDDCRWLVQCPTGTSLSVSARCERGAVTRVEVPTR